MKAITQHVQESTASHGVFDQKLKKMGEQSVRGKRRRFDPLVAPHYGDEKDRYLKILRRVTHKTSDDAPLLIAKATKAQARKDNLTGKKTGEQQRAPRDTARRSKQGRLRRVKK